MTQCLMRSDAISYFREYFEGANVQVGVLIGRLGVANREYVVLSVPTPPLEVRHPSEFCMSLSHIATLNLRVLLAAGWERSRHSPQPYPRQH